MTLKRPYLKSLNRPVDLMHSIRNIVLQSIQYRNSLTIMKPCTYQKSQLETAFYCR